MNRYHILNTITGEPLKNVHTHSEARMWIARYIGKYVFHDGFVYNSKKYSLKELKKALIVKDGYHPQILLPWA